jgi:serine/threonine-protein kinase
MALMIPTLQAKVAQLAVRLGFVSTEQVRAAVDLYHRYEHQGGKDVPSLLRILVARRLLSKERAQALLKHLLLDGPIPTIQSGATAATMQAVQRDSESAPQRQSQRQNQKHAPQESEISLDFENEKEESSAALPPENEVDSRQAMIEGLGATVLHKELKNIKGYKITQVIGEGSMGVVYKAHQISMDRTVALKVLPANRTKDQRFVDEFLAEARNAGRLNHPNLIRVHEVSEKDGIYYYSMEYVEGQRLDEWMDECANGRLPLKDAMNVFIQVAGALDFGFRSGVIHREIRPNTIMISEDGQAKLADLGLVKEEHTRFLDGENAYYVSPEQIKTREVDTRSDIYSLGCCLFHCLTGEPPVEGGAPTAVLHRRLTAAPPHCSDLNQEISVELSGVVAKMMARETRDRFQTPAEVAEALKKVPLVAPQQVRPTPPARPAVARRPLYPRPGAPRSGAARTISGRQGPARGRPGSPGSPGHPKRRGER